MYLSHVISHGAKGLTPDRVQGCSELKQNFISRCQICQEQNVRKGIPTFLGAMLAPMGPFTHLVMDFTDMVERRDRKRWCLVILDRFSRKVEALPTTHNDASTLTKCLAKVFPRFGMCETLSSDNVSTSLPSSSQLCTALGIKQRFSCIYHPQSASMVERCNRMLKTQLAKACR